MRWKTGKGNAAEREIRGDAALREIGLGVFEGGWKRNEEMGGRRTD